MVSKSLKPKARPGLRVPSEQAAPEVREVLNSLRRLVRALRVSSREAERAVGLSGAQLFVLRCLARQSPCSVNELAARTATDQSSVSVVVSRLVASGCVKRVSSSKDRRRAELSLTNKGSALLARAPAAVQDRLLAALVQLRARELGQLAELLDKVVRLAEVDAQSASLFFEERRSATEKDGRRRAR